MRTNETTHVLTEGHALVRRLLGITARRLQERGIEMQFSPDVLAWLIDRSDWRDSFNPIRTLDGYWHQQVAAVIEKLLLEGRLRSGNTLFVSLAETPTGSQIHFDFAPST